MPEKIPYHARLNKDSLQVWNGDTLIATVPSDCLSSEMSHQVHAPGMSMVRMAIIVDRLEVDELPAAIDLRQRGREHLFAHYSNEQENS